MKDVGDWIDIGVVEDKGNMGGLEARFDNWSGDKASLLSSSYWKLPTVNNKQCHELILPTQRVESFGKILPICNNFCKLALFRIGFQII